MPTFSLFLINLEWDVLPSQAASASRPDRDTHNGMERVFCGQPEPLLPKHERKKVGSERCARYMSVAGLGLSIIEHALRTIMTIRARKHTVVWLGIIAMWLMVFSLLASQLLKLTQTADLVAATCSAVKSENARQYTLPDTFSVCDYCDIMAQQATAVTSVPALEMAAILLATVLTLTLAPLALLMTHLPASRVAKAKPAGSVQLPYKTS
ncbi:hypothetical protein BZM27_43555 [Paraburkholderia steynii]|uniref:DUF2946 domain-containing protein n=1 Tax=Paraburkholderia steynii TaxID=1245441 RepID=A0A4R0X1W1_9BURK|nr:hypothetical protein BZM27_43555 [Paraburkholderia steynii]